MTQLVGILNVTPDSFSDGNLFLEPAAAVAQADKLLKDGAALIDVGAESTRPGASPLTSQDERQRLKLILPELVRRFPGKISVDTYHPETAAWALCLGPVIINDVTGMNDPKMVKVIIDKQATCIISHLPGGDIQAAHRAKLLDNIDIVKNDLLAKVAELQAGGLRRWQIILDPGIGFGKTPELNVKLQEFARQVPEYKAMIGYSRKRHLGDKRMELAPNLAAGRLAIASGAAYLRVHDVAGHRQLIQ